MLIAFHKPFGVVTRFRAGGSVRPTLASFGLPPRVYPIGRLDAESEGLLLLSDEPSLTARLLEPGRGHPRTYWAQVEGDPSESALAGLARGIVLDGRATLPCRVRRLAQAPALPPRDPPIRVRKSVPDAWLELVLVEGRNRQVRRMTAAVGHPTLRLVRARIGRLALGDLAAGAWRVLEPADRARALARPPNGNGPGSRSPRGRGSDAVPAPASWVGVAHQRVSAPRNVTLPASEPHARHVGMRRRCGWTRRKAPKSARSLEQVACRGLRPASRHERAQRAHAAPAATLRATQVLQTTPRRWRDPARGASRRWKKLPARRVNPAARGRSKCAGGASGLARPLLARSGARARKETVMLHRVLTCCALASIAAGGGRSAPATNV